MTDTGVGARVARKEDQRFIMGRGRYVDDIHLPRETHAYFLRSPHAHAKIEAIDTSAARAAPGVLAVLTGEDAAADKIGGLICGWMIHSMDGSPMKAGPHPVLAQGKVRYVGDHVAVVVAETLAEAKSAAELIDVSYAELDPVVDPADAPRNQSLVHDGIERNTAFEWSLGAGFVEDNDRRSGAYGRIGLLTRR